MIAKVYKKEDKFKRSIIYSVNFSDRYFGCKKKIIRNYMMQPDYLFIKG